MPSSGKCAVLVLSLQDCWEKRYSAAVCGCSKLVNTESVLCSILDITHIYSLGQIITWRKTLYIEFILIILLYLLDIATRLKFVISS